MDDFDDKRAGQVFLECSNLLSGKSDREIAIIGVAYIEDILTSMLEARIIPGGIDLKRVDSFSFKLKLARSVGILRKKIYDSLNNILTIRNDFAHDYAEKNLNDEKFSCYVDNIFRLNKDILESIKRVSEKNISKKYKEELTALLENKTHRMRLVMASTAAGLSGALPTVERIEEPQ
ncbi:hypothetical protein [Desulfovibrio sp. ZJ200]|uniref:hypothetical protein n=1 Tax=Desulfovibrio sp. ZJ200 TaxID=2709792 RepID=UPI0013EB4AB5|nr:hypothetical protein [Desulfovibrio sp. ZJ200]